MSLRETFDEYQNIKEDGPEREKVEQKLAGLVLQILEDLKDPQVKPNEKVEKMTELRNLLDRLPDQYYDKNADQIFNMCVNLCDKNVYKAYVESGVDLTKSKSENQFPDKLSVNMITFKTLSNLVTVVSAKELLAYLKPVIMKEHKNSQLYLFFVEIILAIIKRIEKKEIYINELLVDILRCLNPALRKYIKYKTKIDNNEYKERPAKVNEFLNNFETWGSKLIKGILGVLHDLINIKATGTGTTILLIEDLVESGSYKDTKILPEVPSSKLMAHYCVLFSLDLLEGLLDCKSHNYFTSEKIEEIIRELHSNILRIHPYAQDYILNYNNQIKYRNYNKDVAKQNERDIYHLPKNKYDMFTIYNSAGISYMVQEFFKNPAEVVPLSPQFKLKLVMPALHIVLNEVSEKENLKISLMTIVFNIVMYLQPIRNIENLNYFDVPLVLFMHSMLQYAGGFTEDKQKGMGIRIFKGLMSLLNDNAQVELISGTIRKTANHALAGFLVNEFRNGIQATLKEVSNEEMSKLNTPFLQVKYLNRLIDTTIAEKNVTGTPDQGELLACGLNLMNYLCVKFVNAQKDRVKEEKSSSSSSNNVLDYAHLGLWVKYLSACEKIKKIVEIEIASNKSVTDQYSEEQRKSMQNRTVFLRQNQLLMLNDSLDKLNDLRIQFKSL